MLAVGSVTFIEVARKVPQLHVIRLHLLVVELVRIFDEKGCFRVLPFATLDIVAIYIVLSDQ